MDNENWIAKLNEYAQRTSSELRYEDVAASGPDHIKTFTRRAVLNDREFPPGTGHSKKEAKKNAAKIAINSLRAESADLQTENVAEASPAQARQTPIQSYISLLNEYGNKKKVLIKATESTTLELNGPTHWCYFMVGEEKFPAAYGKTKKEAKEEAAKLAYDQIIGNISTETGDEKYGSTPSRQGKESKQHATESCNRTISPGVNKDSGNFVGLINDYCQQRKLSHDFVLEDKQGESHNPQFSYRLEINKKVYALGQGKNVKEAKRNAAQLAWTVLQQESNFDDKVNSSAGSEDIEPTARPTWPCKQLIPDTDSESRPSTKGDSAMYTDSQNAEKYREQSPDVKHKIKLAPNFQNLRSKEEPPGFAIPKPNLSERESSSRFESNFDCIERLGHGAFGQVYKAREKLLEKFFAVKIIQYKEKTKREARALSGLHHANIIRYYTCWMEDSSYQMDSKAAKHPTDGSPIKYLYIQMELCDSKTLREWINEKNTENANTSSLDAKNREERLTIALQLASGVEYIHSKKFIHRDLKPSNIMFGEDKDVKIGDFGLVTDENDDAENLIDRTAYKGTPIYMAPEQKSCKTYDRKVDIFALGLIYFELLWKINRDSIQIWENARNQSLPEEFCHEFHEESRIIGSMLCVQPEERPEASQLKNDIEKCTNTLKNICSERHTV